MNDFVEFEAACGFQLIATVSLPLLLLFFLINFILLIYFLQHTNLSVSETISSWTKEWEEWDRNSLQLCSSTSYLVMQLLSVSVFCLPLAVAIFSHLAKNECIWPWLGFYDLIQNFFIADWSSSLWRLYQQGSQASFTPQVSCSLKLLHFILKHE